MVNSRNKGQRGEREVIELIRKIFGVKYARTPLSGGMDIKGDIRKPYKQKPTICDLFHWEIKYQEHLNIWKAFEQSENDSRKDPTNPIPIVAFRRNNSKWLLTLGLDEFLELLLELQRWRQSGTEGADGFSNLLSPIGTNPDVLKKQTLEDWVAEKDEHKRKKEERKQKKKELEDKYGKRD